MAVSAAEIRKSELTLLTAGGGEGMLERPKKRALVQVVFAREHRHRDCCVYKALGGRCDCALAVKTYP